MRVTWCGLQYLWRMFQTSGGVTRASTPHKSRRTLVAADYISSDHVRPVRYVTKVMCDATVATGATAQRRALSAIGTTDVFKGATRDVHDLNPQLYLSALFVVAK